MTKLSSERKELIFDYCAGLASEQEAGEAEHLISSHHEAARIKAKFRAVFSLFDTIKHEPCPDHLVESTILRVNNVSRSTQLKLQQLLAEEQSKTTANRWWWNMGELMATAAAIMLFAGVLIPSLKYARYNYWKNYCAGQMASIGRGIANYKADHDGRMPAASFQAGQPWWKIGQPGNLNQSNTRTIWLLVKNGYVKPEDFVCPGRTEGKVVRLKLSELQKYNDFPGRKYVSYSFRIICDKSKERGLRGRKVLMADLNPLFEELPQNYSQPLRLELNDDLLSRNSSSHNYRGQNVLFCDGSAKFTKTRHVDDISQDDIFTLRNTRVYQGIEVPLSESDAFLAP